MDTSLHYIQISDYGHNEFAWTRPGDPLLAQPNISLVRHWRTKEMYSNYWYFSFAPPNLCFWRSKGGTKPSMIKLATKKIRTLLRALFASNLGDFKKPMNSINYSSSVSCFMDVNWNDNRIDRIETVHPELQITAERDLTASKRFDSFEYTGDVTV